MKKFRNIISLLFLLISLLSVNVFNAGCNNSSSALVLDSSSRSKLDTIFPNTAVGQMLKKHINAAMGNGENAESIYQQSLSVLRADTAAAEGLYTIYRKVPPANFMLRTMLAESLKELHSPNALAYLGNIAKEKIPDNLYPENAEINTKQDEIVIRITAVEGISKLASDSVAAAEKLLIELTGHDDLTVRQMAVRGYLQSAFGNRDKKIEELKAKLPKEEYWYITADTTAIKKVKYPEMPAQFNLETKNASNTPKIK
jgi:hypothetical protein